MKTFQAVYANGVLKPSEPVDLPENCRVEIEVRETPPADEKPGLDEVYGIMAKRFNSGESDVAERHNEHQP